MVQSLKCWITHFVCGHCKQVETLSVLCILWWNTVRHGSFEGYFMVCRSAGDFIVETWCTFNNFIQTEVILLEINAKCDCVWYWSQKRRKKEAQNDSLYYSSQYQAHFYTTAQYINRFDGNYLLLCTSISSLIWLLKNRHDLFCSHCVVFAALCLT